MSASLTPQMQDLKTKVKVGRFAPEQTNTISYHGSFGANHDNSFTMSHFQQDFDIRIKESTPDKLVLDMLGVDAPLANAFRRILISEVPTMAIEWISVVRNTSIVQDEVLCHRMGLIPIQVDPRLFQYPSSALCTATVDPTRLQRLQSVSTVKSMNEYSAHTNDASRPYPPSHSGYLPIGANLSSEVWHVPEQVMDNETILFRLKVKCDGSKRVPNKYNYGAEEYEHQKVYSGDLEWVPLGDQAQRFKHDPIRPVHSDILIAKLNPGQEIHLECYCVKGIGKDHAKFSPVATATYRLMPHISFKKSNVSGGGGNAASSGKVKGRHAQELVKICPMNVFDIEDDEAIVARPRDCTMCRECIRTDEWEKKVSLERLKNHYIFSIESVGMMRPEDIFREALRIFYDKCLQHAKSIQAQISPSTDDVTDFVLQ